MQIFLGMITEVMLPGIYAYIPHSFSRPKPSKPWFNTACSRALHDGEVAHKRYLSLPSPESHELYISARNHAKSVLQLAKNSFIHRKCQNLSRYNSPRDFWHLAKTSPTTLLYHLSLLQFNQMTPMPSHLSLKLNSSLKPFAKNSTLDDSGLVPPSPPPSDYFMLPIKILRNDVFHALAGLHKPSEGLWT